MKKIILFFSIFLIQVLNAQDSHLEHLTNKKDAFGKTIEGYKGEVHVINGEVFDDSSFVPSPISHARLVLKSGASEIIHLNSDNLGEFSHQMNLPDGEYSIEVVSDGWGGQQFFKVKNQHSDKINLRAVKTVKSKKNNLNILSHKKKNS